MLIDLHAHSSGISRCCQIPFDAVLKQALDNGMDGIVLTNHYQSSYAEEGRVDEFVERYIAEFIAAERYGRQIGCRVFFGVEVTMELYPNVHMLIYGVEPEFLRKHPRLFDCTQRELFELVKSGGGVLIQAHPFRNGATVLDTDYLDGVEINCHPLYGNSYSKELLEIAREKQLIVTCGGDYHADTYRPKCGMYLPDEIKDHRDLRDYLLSAGGKMLCVQEPNTDGCSVIEIR
ncbi:MAG: hypothetical protein E7451_08830 [Ruminococcaceae bacterium]|nr:hypothetical protein [Oscillospiraceae bacterium]